MHKKNKTMNKTVYQTSLILLILIAFSCKQTEITDTDPLQGFVLVKGMEFSSRNQVINIGDFEILDHPVTNLEYKRFTDATGYPVPHHWTNGKIPTGKEEYPVIFVNRDDAEAYTRWLTKVSGRIHRIPTSY